MNCILAHNKIPKSLPKGYSGYTRFDCAIDDTFNGTGLYGYFGKNGYAIEKNILFIVISMRII